MHVGDDQGLDAIDGEVQRQLVVVRRIRSLELSAVDEHAAVFVHPQLMAGAGNAFAGTMVDKPGLLHR